MPETKALLPVAPKQILVVDDEEAIVRLISNLLGIKGYEVTGATSPVEALKLFTAWPEYWDLVITDMLMPGMTGAQLAEELLKIRPELPIILCSGYCTVSAKESQKMGIFAYLQKPLDFKTLESTIRAALGLDR